MLEATEHMIEEAISSQTSKVDAAIAKIVEDKHNVPIAAVLRNRFDELEKLIEIGISISTIINALNDAGIEISNTVFRTTMSRIRTKRRKAKERGEESPRMRPAAHGAASKPAATSKPVPSIPPVKTEATARENEIDEETGRPMSATRKRLYDVADKYVTEPRNNGLTRLIRQSAEREP